MTTASAVAVATVAMAMPAAMGARSGTPTPRSDALVTVFTYAETYIPAAVMERAKRVATRAFAAAGVEIRWSQGKRFGEPRQIDSGEMLTVVFDDAAPANLPPRALASTNICCTGGDADVHVFYNRVAAFEDPAHMPEFLGNVLAHELTHALQGVARHSSEGLMKATWRTRDYAEMVHGPLPFAAADLELLAAHFKKAGRP